MSHAKKSFSFSAISTFQSCPRSYKYKYIDQLPEAFTSIEAYMGSCVHEALEWAYSQRQEGYEPTLEMALDQYKHTWNNGNFQEIKIVKEEQSKEDYYKEGRDFIASYFQRVFPFDQSTTIYLEHSFELPLDEEIVFRGVIDRIAKEPDGTLRVTDYKTGRVGHPLDTLQLPSYALYIFQHNIDAEIQLCYEDLRQQRTVAVPYQRKDARGVKEELVKEIRQIRDTKIDEFITKPSLLCLWCGYNHICDNPHESVGRGTGGTSGTRSTGSTVSTVSTASSGSIGDGPNPAVKSEVRPEGSNSGSGSESDSGYLEACPLCGGELRERKGKFGPFLGCRNFPQCRYSRDITGDGSRLAGNPNVEGKDICPECGSLLRRRNGKYGDFMGCSNYPECRFTRPL